MNHNLFTVNNPKTEKGEKLGWLTLVLHLAPANSAPGGPSVCPRSTPMCRDTCLFYAGRGAFQTVRNARIRRTQEYRKSPAEFARKLAEEVEHYQRYAWKKGMQLAVRV